MWEGTAPAIPHRHFPRQPLKPWVSDRLVRAPTRSEGEGERGTEMGEEMREASAVGYEVRGWRRKRYGQVPGSDT